MEKKFRVIHKNGLHARLAGILVNEVLKYDCESYLLLGEKKANLKSIMCVLTLGIFSGSDITINVSGEEETEAMEGISYVLEEMKIAKEVK